MFGKYSFPNLVKMYNDNKPLFDAYLNGHSVEGIDGDDSDKAKKISGLGLGPIIILMMAHIILYIWAIVITISRWNLIPDWARILSVLCIIFHFPVLSIIFVYASSSSKTDENLGIELKSRYAGCGKW
jgi:hypothetical protein